MVDIEWRQGELQAFGHQISNKFRGSTTTKRVMAGKLIINILSYVVSPHPLYKFGCIFSLLHVESVKLIMW